MDGMPKLILTMFIFYHKNLKKKKQKPTFLDILSFRISFLYI